MITISFARHQFPPVVIRHAVWLYARFTLSYRDVEELLAERGLDVSYETVRLGPEVRTAFCPGASPPSLPPDLAMASRAERVAHGPKLPQPEGPENCFDTAFPSPMRRELCALSACATRAARAGSLAEIGRANKGDDPEVDG
jgi:hypothetical protein